MFDPEKLYPNTDTALDVIAPKSTRDHWRCEGKGPPYLKFGQRIMYRGADLLEWIDGQRVVPQAA